MSMLRARPQRQFPAADKRGEAGAALVLALVFMVVGALLVGVLATLTTTHLATTSSFQASRSQAYAADAGLDAAIQVNRYVSRGCRPFGPQSVLGTSVTVSCIGTPFNATATSGSATLTCVSPCYFVPADASSAQAVTGSAVAANTTISAVGGSTTATISAPATGTGTVTVGTGGQRLDVLWACAPSSSPSSCSATNAVATAVVLFDDLDESSPGCSAQTPCARAGYSYQVVSWVDSSTNG